MRTTMTILACACALVGGCDGTATGDDDAGIDPASDGGPLPLADSAAPPPLPDGGQETCRDPEARYRDLDNDGYGDPAARVDTCEPLEGFVANADDCNDDCDRCHPGGSETCDGLDDDCDGVIDEDAHGTFYADADGDGHGQLASTTTACTPPLGYVSTSDDCDDSCPTCFPGRAESCDGLDNDCDADVDEGVLLTFYEDADMDGHGRDERATLACAAPAGHVATGGDCDDTDASRYPGASELCNGGDDDCDGAPDETFTCARGSTVGCTTTCGSAGRGTCNSVCELPAVVSCAPPAESCTYADDDCDSWRDEDRYTVSPRLSAPGLGEMYQPRAALCGAANICSFWTFGSQVYATRHNLDGTVVGPTHVPLISTTVYDVASFGPSELVMAHREGTVVRVAFLDPATLRPTRTVSITSAPSYLRVVIDSSYVWIYALEGTAIRRYFVSKSSTGGWSGPQAVGATDVPFDVAAASAGLHYVASINPIRHDVLELTRVSTSVTASVFAWTAAGVTLRDPAIAARGPDIVVAWGEHGVAVPQRRLRLGRRSGFTGVTRFLTLAAGRTTRNSGQMHLMMEVESRNDGTFLVAANEGDGGVYGSLRAYDVQLLPTLMRASAYIIEPLESTYRSVAIVPQAARSDVVFYPPPRRSEIAWRRLGC